VLPVEVAVGRAAAGRCHRTLPDVARPVTPGRARPSRPTPSRGPSTRWD